MTKRKKVSGPTRKQLQAALDEANVRANLHKSRYYQVLTECHSMQRELQGYRGIFRAEVEQVFDFPPCDMLNIRLCIDPRVVGLAKADEITLRVSRAVQDLLTHGARSAVSRLQL